MEGMLQLQHGNCSQGDLIDWREPARRLSLRKRAFWDLVHHEGLPHYRFNARVIRFRMSEVENWLGTRKIGGCE
jgi:predicted DNA-binding transcriptional regulator AlpA